MTQKQRSIAIIVTFLLLCIMVLLVIFMSGTKNTTIRSAPQFTGPPIAIFEGKKSTEFYDSQSENNYNAARKIIGDFLINHEKIKTKSGAETTAIAEITSYSNQYGPDTQYITNVEFKSRDNGKTYKAQIINYLNNSQSSRIIIADYGYEKTFGDFID